MSLKICNTLGDIVKYAQSLNQRNSVGFKIKHVALDVNGDWRGFKSYPCWSTEDVGYFSIDQSVNMSKIALEEDVRLHFRGNVLMSSSSVPDGDTIVTKELVKNWLLHYNKNNINQYRFITNSAGRWLVHMSIPTKDELGSYRSENELDIVSHYSSYDNFIVFDNHKNNNTIYDLYRDCNLTNYISDKIDMQYLVDDIHAYIDTYSEYTFATLSASKSSIILWKDLPEWDNEKNAYFSNKSSDYIVITFSDLSVNVDVKIDVIDSFVYVGDDPILHRVWNDPKVDNDSDYEDDLDLITDRPVYSAEDDDDEIEHLGEDLLSTHQINNFSRESSEEYININQLIAIKTSLELEVSELSQKNIGLSTQILINNNSKKSILKNIAKIDKIINTYNEIKDIL